ncbi:MAG: DivIVA domain-containing protein [Inconstantimicrobium porci]|uniref:DivIVA domain-containing protein n=1 Tax=Inconstantimicrobium porci TaxID=2652291 RepID=UPI002A914A5D|nr:DivIVA domain-containing protein [Inconstantimicrobium porci]MDY5913610.1 DivIVA domain-containing protein [Inconstantimicrobium porci]
MKLTPMEISNKEFKRGIRGYSVEEVDEFLDKIVEDYESLFKENTSLKEKLSGLNEKIEHYSKIENTIQNTLVLAQNTAEQSKLTAKKESELIIKNANDTAQKILDKAHSDVLQINDEYDKVKQEFTKFRTKYRNFMNTQLDTFNELEKDYVKNFSIAQAADDSSLDDKGIEVVDDTTETIKNLDEEHFDDGIDEIKSFFAKK